MYRFNKKWQIASFSIANLNTTNVSVQSANVSFVKILTAFKYNKCIGSIKLQKKHHFDLIGFKYNKCIGSIYYRKFI